jgi:hypothetical protein
MLTIATWNLDRLSPRSWSRIRGCLKSIKSHGVAESDYETISPSFKALLRIQRNHSFIQQHQFLH